MIVPELRVPEPAGLTSEQGGVVEHTRSQAPSVLVLRQVDTAVLDEQAELSRRFCADTPVVGRFRPIVAARVRQDLMDKAEIALLQQQVTDFLVQLKRVVERVELWSGADEIGTVENR